MVELAMSKIEMMDDYLERFEGKMSGSGISKVVKEVFGIDLDAMERLINERLGSFELQWESTTLPLSHVVIDSYLDHHGRDMTGTEVRGMINHFFGVNLDGIASLEKARISIYSKGQWIVQHANDLFVIHTGAGDTDVKIFSTDYFTEKTGSNELPSELRQSLLRLGFSYDEKMGSCHFSTSTGQAVPDAFKGQTIGTIVEFIHNYYGQL
ncbi:hypothetical protein [Sporosarcina sp. JAI121]|uniref:hypothetical protein n=1 Tax=Sporosarcina sp. JAI121 TaxID=2723064 RepID=UPI0017C19C2E|nr:hypothetical protein [Sporosarcina sp. JAI121]NYF23626.1 hypothetical protein [Sporosarcina sp. JAI121]